MPIKTPDGKLVFKIVYWGPSMGGKTTSVFWLSKNDPELIKGDLQSIADPTGRTLFFDRAVAGVGKITFQVYTVAGQKRHKGQRKVILQGVDGVIFVWDAQKEFWDDNIWSVNELKDFLIHEENGSKTPVIIMVNKRDLPNTVTKDEVRNVFDNVFDNGFSDILVYETIAVDGLNVKRAFIQLCREIVIRYYEAIKQA
ncbi:ATP/GTP-binding protein [Candidatus Borrarchaeum sp.]|uniref:GTP-binding protein n=1 Tax=Candidatus Borrarchaeum sp. TaxID=2846742 RepID=UPI00257B58FA|nr:ADP-ribosylation factor-like protein [Candidatus Borrarchaeum sp.]